MKVFVYEYCCSQPLRGEPTARALRSEGLAMLTAIMSDFARVRGVDSIALVADDAPPLPFACHRVQWDGERHEFRRLSREADYTLVVAPEIDGILEDRCGLVLKMGGKLLGPDLDAIRLTADKYRLYEHFVKHEIPTPFTRLLVEVGQPLTSDLFPCVLKPRYGVGSLSMRYIRREKDLEAVVASTPSLEYLLQRHVAGQAVSVALLLGPQQSITLKPAMQRISNDGRFRYRGGSAPLEEPLAQRVRNLALRAVRCVPGLSGYVGVDLVLGQCVDRKEDSVIEINPRLTTSYIGLRQLARSNLANALLNVVCGRSVKLSWKRGVHVSWTPKG